MSRYVVMAGDRWVPAIYGPGKGSAVTRVNEDASIWPNYDRAVVAARAAADCTSSPVAIHSIEEPSY